MTDFFTVPGIEGFLCEDCTEAMEEARYVTDVPDMVTCRLCAIVAVPAWDALDSDIQDDLIEWYNAVDVNPDDQLLLATLFDEGHFEAGNCGNCGTRYRRAYPDSWDNFQGCYNDEGEGDLCGECTALYYSLDRLRG